MLRPKKGRRIVLGMLCGGLAVFVFFTLLFLFATRRRAFDGFDGELSLDWRIINSDPSHVSLTKKPGTLTITTQKGALHVSRKDTQNVFLIANPIGVDGDFTVTTCIDSFKPRVPWHQAGIICFNDEDNYVKWVCIWNRLVNRVDMQVLPESKGQPQLSVNDRYVGEAPQVSRIWLSVRKLGNRYTFSTSTDGESYVVHRELRWGDGSTSWIGLLATNGLRDGVPEIDASFDLFEVRTVTAVDAILEMFRGKDSDVHGESPESD